MIKVIFTIDGSDYPMTQMTHVRPQVGDWFRFSGRWFEAVEVSPMFCQLPFLPGSYGVPQGVMAVDIKLATVGPTNLQFEV